MSSPPSLKSIASSLSANTNLLTQLLEEKGLPQPSLSVHDGQQTVPDSIEFEQLHAARTAIQEQAQLLLDLVTGPVEMATTWPICSLHDTSALILIYHCKLYQHIPLNGTATFENIAAKSGLDIHRTRLALRHAMTRRFFCEPQPNHVAHTAASALLVTQPDFVDFLGHQLNDTLPAVANLSKTIDRYGNSTEPNHSATNVAFGTDENPMSFIASGTVSGPRFSGAMRWVAKTGSFDDRHIVENYPWDDFGEGTVVDVAGGTGHLSLSLAQAYPKLRFIVQDLPEQGKAFSVPSHLQDRVQFMSHDMFQPQPIAADAYILRLICHDWPDVASSQILRQLVPAMRDGARIILVEAVMLEPGHVSGPAERVYSTSALHMAVTYNGKERTEAEWENIIKNADSRLKLNRVITPRRSHCSVIEAVFHS
ncbi:hypothetical protein DTO282F9_3425 [Paecilomyces variotii]|nr:hypothetical protein DTO282F9_3425 [Paecilomyces variotii]